jgi:uncharacterized protein (DUF1697 family)
MTVYIAFLSAINVGGKNKIKMAVLKRVFEAIGLHEVRTYIQSGNVLFRSDDSEASLCSKIEHELESVFGIPLKVILRTSAELEQIIANQPFSKEEIMEAESLADVETRYVALLAHDLLSEKIECLDIHASQSDRCRIRGREVYLLFHHSIRDSKIAGNLYKLDVPMTVRNWNVLSKLSELAKTYV